MNCLLSAFADEYSNDFGTQLAMLRENSVAYIEPRFIDQKNVADLTPAEANEVRKKLDDSGIKVSSIGSPLGKSKLSDDFRTELERTKRVIELAGILGTDRVRIFSFYPADGHDIRESFDEVAGRLAKMTGLAKSAGVTLCHENEAGIFGESPDDCKRLLDALPELGCVFDMGNFVLGGYEPLSAFELLRDRISYFHIKDALFAGAIVPPGKGEAKIAEIIGEFSGEREVTVTLEPHLETFDGFNSLVIPGKKFENPYKFESREAAFLTALCDMKNLIRMESKENPQ